MSEKGGKRTFDIVASPQVGVLMRMWRKSLIVSGGLLAIAAALWAPSFVAANNRGETTEASDCLDRLDAPGNPDAERPVLVLVETDPWAMVIGSDSPRFALYENGLAIYRTKDGFREVILDRDRADDFRMAAKVGVLACLEKSYSTSNSTDQPTEHLFFGRGGALSSISVYGRIRIEGQEEIPAALTQAYDRLVSFDDPKARPWMPDFVEVMVWPYQYAPEPSIVWPSKWPGLTDPRTAKRGDAYSLYVPSSDYESLQAFLKTRRKKGAVEIDGKKWAVSLRFPFPSETNWRAGARKPE